MMKAWYKTAFSGLYKQVLANTYTPAASLQQAKRVKRLLGLRPGMQVLDAPAARGV